MKTTVSDRIRICFITQRLPRSGAAADYGYLWPLCLALTEQGHDVNVITASTTTKSLPSAETVSGVHIHYIEDTLPGSYNVHFREAVLDVFEQLHVEEPFDILHCVDKSGYAVALHKKALKVAVATDIKGIELDEMFGVMGLTEETVTSYLLTSLSVAAKFLRSYFGEDHRYLKAGNGVFVTSKLQKDILERYYLIPAARIYTIPYGINAKVEAPQECHPFEELGIEAGTKIVLAISPMGQIEELQNLLRAFERVVIKKPRTALVIVGDGPKKHQLEETVLNLALASKVYFTGRIEPEKEDQLLSGCDIYVNLHSRSSGFDGPVLDAMAWRKTVIASEVGSGTDLIQNAVDGFLLRPTDITTMTRLILDAVSGLIDLKNIGENARQKILKMFDTSRMVDETIQAYKKILQQHGKWNKK